MLQKWVRAFLLRESTYKLFPVTKNASQRESIRIDWEFLMVCEGQNRGQEGRRGTNIVSK
jgi:hypothetical protein